MFVDAELQDKFQRARLEKSRENAELMARAAELKEKYFRIEEEHRASQFAVREEARAKVSSTTAYTPKQAQKYFEETDQTHLTGITNTNTTEQIQ
jgi:hypothetical protein